MNEHIDPARPLSSPNPQPQEVVARLFGKPRDAAVVVAARAALRVIPVLAFQFGLPSRGLSEAQRFAVLRVFRWTSAAWTAAAYPGRSAELRPAAAAAGSRSDRETKSDAESAAAWASVAAGARRPGNFSSQAVLFADRAALSVDSLGSEDLLNSCTADTESLERGFSPVTLALSSTLWPSTPEWAFEGWAQLERALLDANENWEVWTNWYEARLKAGATDQVLEVARAMIPREVWDQGPKVVNGQINGWLEEREIWHHATSDNSAASADVTPSARGEISAIRSPRPGAGERTGRSHVGGEIVGTARRPARTASDSAARDIKGASAAPVTRGHRASTAIGKAVLKNRVEIDVAAASLLLLIDERLKSLREQRPNSSEAQAARDAAIADCEDLKRRVELFLGAASQFAAKKAKETSVVETTNSLAAGIGDWWSKRHVQICDRAFEMGLFGFGVTICLLAGAGGALAVGIPGAMVGGKPVVEVIKAFAKRPHTKPD